MGNVCRIIKLDLIIKSDILEQNRSKLKKEGKDKEDIDTVIDELDRSLGSLANKKQREKLRETFPIETIKE